MAGEGGVLSDYQRARLPAPRADRNAALPPRPRQGNRVRTSAVISSRRRLVFFLSSDLSGVASRAIDIFHLDQDSGRDSIHIGHAEWEAIDLELSARDHVQVDKVLYDEAAALSQ